MRPGSLAHVKKLLLASDEDREEPAGAGIRASIREELWKSAGPWLPDESLLEAYEESILEVSLRGIKWPSFSQDRPYDKIPVFAKEECPPELVDLCRREYRALDNAIMSEDQIMVYCMWWAHYVLYPELHREVRSYL